MPQVDKIVSGGQTGVDRAALDVALRLGIPCGGWCPCGRLAEDGPIPESYPLRETETPDYAERTELNVRDSDGTLVLTWTPPTQGTAYTVDMARMQGKPCCVVDLRDSTATDAAARWLDRHNVRTLNVAGPRASKYPRIYAMASGFLERLLQPQTTKPEPETDPRD